MYNRYLRVSIFHKVFIIASLFYSLNFFNAAHAEVEYAIKPVPKYITTYPVPQDVQIPLSQISDGLHFLLVDFQTVVQENEVIHYKHLAYKPLNQDGIKEAAQININFDPTYETLFLHQITIHREGKIIPRLKQAQVNILQREKDLEYQIYDASKTASIILEDIRLGDIVEYSFSLHGHNPVFGGKYFGGFDMQWKVPVTHLRTRILWPKSRILYIKNHNTDIEPEIQDGKLFREYRWHQDDVPPIYPESETPNWYNQFPWIQLSEFPDWQAVVNWALPLYKASVPLTDDLYGLIKAMDLAGQSAEDKILQVLEFVQNEIRYMGLEMGPRSHAPDSPSKILKRRFGDCKDKSLLMVTLLRSLGINAHVALANTRAGRGLVQWHPTPVAFNHVLVQAELDGNTYWLDPTFLYQKGTLRTLYQPDYDLALVIKHDSKALVPMTRLTDAAGTKKTISEEFDLSKGFSSPTQYKIKTVFDGASAESMRRTLANSSREDLQEKFLNFYAKTYPSISIDKNFAVEDFAKENRVIITETYVIHDIWENSKDNNKRVEASFYASELYDYITLPQKTIRTTPLSNYHPVEIQQDITVLLPEPWPIEPEDNVITDKAYSFKRKIAYQNKTLKMSYYFKSLADHIAPEDVRQYIKNIQSVDNVLGYTLFQVNPELPEEELSSSEINWPLLMLAVTVTLLNVLLAVFLYRYQPGLSDDQSAYSSPDLNGIRGWLIFPAIGITFQPIKIIKDVYDMIPTYALSAWVSLTSKTSELYNVYWAPILLFELVVNISLVVFSILLIFLFFNKKRMLPRAYIGFLVFALFVHVTDYSLLHLIPSALEAGQEGNPNLITMAFTSGLWIWYFLVSERVKATFVK